MDSELKTNFGIILEIFLLIPLIHEDRVENFGELKKPTHEYNPKIFGIGFQKEGIVGRETSEGFSKEFFHRSDLERNSSPLRSFLHFSNRLEKREERLPTSPIFIDKTLLS